MSFINVDLGDGVITQMEEADLEGPLLSTFENDHERTVATEYRLNGRVVHRSVHVHLKQGLGIEAAMGAFGG
jgi:hypothetical protein